MTPEAKDFFHHLHDTLVLLGADPQVVSIYDDPEAITSGDVSWLRRYNGKLLDQTKQKLVDINKIAIQVVPREPDDDDRLGFDIYQPEKT